MSNYTSNRSSKPEAGGEMSTLLKYLTNRISTGITPSGSVHTTDSGINKLIQSKDISHKHLTISAMQLANTDWGTDTKIQYLIQDSIIVLSRGVLPLANVFLGEESDKAIVSNTFFVVNLSESGKELLRPEYIAWYINNASEAKRHFEINARGTNLVMTSIQTLRDLPVFIPTLGQQDKIVKDFIQTQHDINIINRMIELRREHNKAHSEKIMYDSLNNQSRQPDYM